MVDQVERVPVEEAALSLDPEAVDLDLSAVLDDVERAIGHLDLDVGLFTDEELHWISDAEVVADDDLEAPRLGQLSPDEREIAVEAVLHTMLARGDLRLVGDGEVMAAGRYALLATLRRAPLGVARVHLDVRGEEPVRAALYHVTEQVVMLEEVTPFGVHHVVLVSALRAAAWLLRALAPERLDPSDGEPATATTLEGLPVDTNDLAARAERTALLTTGRATTGRVEQGSFTTYLIDARLQVLGGWTEEGGQGQVTLEAFGEASAATWARWVVEEAIRPDPAVYSAT